YRGTWHCLTSTIRNEHVIGLYKGMSSPLVGVAVINSLLFGAYGWFLRRLGPSDPDLDPSVRTIFLAGGASGIINAFFSTPMELIKIRLQNQTQAVVAGQPRFTGNRDVIRHIWRTEGFRGYYRGLAATLVRETPSYGAYFASFEVLSEWLCPDSSDSLAESENTLPILVAGGGAGVAGWVITYPFDVIKTQMQAPAASAYRSVMHCATTLYHRHGARFFFQGLTATCIRAFPTNAATFYAVVWAKSVL
ncbi:mitochondrial carrier, partial [Caulochytrium protostelioides]